VKTHPSRRGEPHLRLIIYNRSASAKREERKTLILAVRSRRQFEGSLFLSFSLSLSLSHTHTHTHTQPHPPNTPLIFYTERLPCFDRFHVKSPLLQYIITVTFIFSALKLVALTRFRKGLDGMQI